MKHRICQNVKALELHVLSSEYLYHLQCTIAIIRETF